MKNLKIKCLFTFSFFLISIFGYSQDILSKLDKEHSKKTIYQIATFKTSRIGLGHSTELRKKGALEISLFNRFWNLEEAPEKRFIVDEVNIRFGLNYAITDNLTIGGGYSNFDKISDGFLKLKLLKQTQDSGKTPLSIVYFQGFSHRNKSDFIDNLYTPDEIVNTEVFSFVSQFLIAKKFSRDLSVQLSPTYINHNKQFFKDQPLHQFALGLGARYKINGHTSLVSEYYYNFNPGHSVATFNPFMFGVNWELSHLLLQFQATNTRHLVESAVITQTQNSFNFKDGNFHFGFNAIFVLHTKKNKI